MDSLRGRLLLASPALLDPNFHRTVILVAEHTGTGAMGLVLNRPADATVGEAVPGLAGIVESDAAVHVGGPVAADAVVVLAEFDDHSLAGAMLDGDLGFLAGATEDLDALAAGVRRARVFAGHAGWGPGQLEAELEEESWIVEAPLSDEIFTAQPEALWADVLRRKGREYALLATMPPDPSLN
ncbi:MAG TPA: YqgE/AlgH family protein [Solirubrobacteraceae bacterium]|nr:YqgE/AlgH family protein [Solirubrobacteraceae bacterium]